MACQGGSRRDCGMDGWMEGGEEKNGFDGQVSIPAVAILDGHAATAAPTWITCFFHIFCCHGIIWGIMKYLP